MRANLTVSAYVLNSLTTDFFQINLLNIQHPLNVQQLNKTTIGYFAPVTQDSNTWPQNFMNSFSCINT